MRKLDSMIAQFVGDLLRTIGEASVDELRELFAGRLESEKLSELPVDFATPVVPATSATAATLTKMAASASVRHSAPPEAARGEGRARVAPRRSAVLLSATASGPIAPPGALDITDPESLLSLGGPDVHKQSASTGASLSAVSPLSNGALSDSAHADGVRIPSRARAQALLEVRDRATPATLGESGRTGRHTEHDVDSPASGVRPVGSGMTVKLSDNETLARVSNSGVVIRRRKRA
jgi:hypothetical protein